MDWQVWRYIVDNGIMQPEALRAAVLERQDELQRQGDDLDSEIARVRRALTRADERRLFYLRQAARGGITDAELDLVLAETDDEKEAMSEQLADLLTLRDDAQARDSALEQFTTLAGQLQAQLPAIDQTPEDLASLDEQERRCVLEHRQEIVRLLVQDLRVFSDGTVELVWVLGGSADGSEFESTASRRC